MCLSDVSEFWREKSGVAAVSLIVHVAAFHFIVICEDILIFALTL